MLEKLCQIPVKSYWKKLKDGAADCERRSFTSSEIKLDLNKYKTLNDREKQLKYDLCDFQYSFDIEGVYTGGVFNVDLNILNTVLVNQLRILFFFLRLSVVRSNTTHKGALLLAVATVRSCHHVL